MVKVLKAATWMFVALTMLVIAIAILISIIKK